MKVNIELEGFERLNLTFLFSFKDKWMNMGYEDDELKPFQEAQTDLNDQKRIGKTGKEFFFSTIIE